MQLCHCDIVPSVNITTIIDAPPQSVHMASIVSVASCQSMQLKGPLQLWR